MHSLKLPNGLEILAFPSKGKEIGIALAIGIGSAYEPQELRGISHFVEHMFFKSNQKYSSREMNEIFEFSGASFNASTSFEDTIIYGSVLKKSFAKVLDALVQAFVNPTYKKEEFAREKGVILAEIHESLDDPTSYLGILAGRALFYGSPYGEPVAGSKKTAKAISLKQLTSFKEKFYFPTNSKLILVGPVDDELDKVSKLFATLEPKEVELPKPSFGSSRNLQESKKLEEAYYAYGWKTTEGSLEELLAGKSLKWLVGGGFTSLLFQELREKAGIGYSASCDYYPLAKGGLFMLRVDGFDPRKRDKVREIIHNLPNKAKTLSEEFIKGRKNYALFIFNQRKKHLDRKAHDQARLAQLGFTLSVDEYAKKVFEFDRKRISKFLNEIKPVEVWLEPMR